MNDTTKLMQEIARVVNRALNPNGDAPNGFVLLVFPADGPEGQKTNYVSNCDRKEILVAMKEVVARFEGQPYQTGRA